MPQVTALPLGLKHSLLFYVAAATSRYFGAEEMTTKFPDYFRSTGGGGPPWTQSSEFRSIACHRTVTVVAERDRGLRPERSAA